MYFRAFLGVAGDESAVEASRLVGGLRRFLEDREVTQLTVSPEDPAAGLLDSAHRIGAAAAATLVTATLAGARDRYLFLVADGLYLAASAGESDERPSLQVEARGGARSVLRLSHAEGVIPGDRIRRFTLIGRFLSILPVLHHVDDCPRLELLFMQRGRREPVRRAARSLARWVAEVWHVGADVTVLVNRTALGSYGLLRWAAHPARRGAARIARRERLGSPPDAPWAVELHYRAGGSAQHAPGAYEYAYLVAAGHRDVMAPGMLDSERLSEMGTPVLLGSEGGVDRYGWSKQQNRTDGRVVEFLRLSSDVYRWRKE